MHLATQSGLCWIATMATMFFATWTWRCFMPDIEFFWFASIALQIVAAIAFLPNGFDWLLNTQSVDLQSVDGAALVTNAESFSANVMGAALGVVVWAIWWRVGARWRG